MAEELRHNVRNTQSKRSLNAWAEKQGVNPSYALTITIETTPHMGPLRVLNLEPRMEKIAETICKLAQSSIEETGNNILYLAFGCLQWIEKERVLDAPLILLPVEITRSTGRGGGNTFYLGASDDAPIANVTLKLASPAVV